MFVFMIMFSENLLWWHQKFWQLLASLRIRGLTWKCH